MRKLIFGTLLILFVFSLSGCTGVYQERRVQHPGGEICLEPERLSPSEADRCHRLLWGP
jgi:hypothetical protein